MNFTAINETLKTIAKLIDHLVSVALKLILIGAVIVFEQWVENY